MTGISKDVEFDSRNAKIDAQLLREQLLKGKRAKAKVIKIVHGVPRCTVHILPERSHSKTIV